MGLLVPNVKNVQARSIFDIAAELNRLQKEVGLCTRRLNGCGTVWERQGVVVVVVCSFFCWFSIVFVEYLSI